MQETNASLISLISPAKGRSSGTAFLLKNSADLSVVSSTRDCGGRVVPVICSVSGKQVNLVSACAPNNPSCRRESFQDILQNYLETDVTNILAGDFNCVDSIPLDTLAHSQGISTSLGSPELQTCVRAFAMADQWRVNNPSTKVYTWSNKVGSCASRLDRIFVSKDLSVLKQECTFFPYSNHKVLCADIDIDVSGMHCESTMEWKLNTSVLGERGYKEKIQPLIQDCSTLIEAFDNPLIWWDNFKQRVKAVSIAFCTRRKRNNDQEIECLKDQSEFADSGQEVGKLKDKLRKLQDEKLEGMAVRARCSKDLQDEKCTAYFFDRIRQRRNKNNVSSVRNSKGELVKEDKDILEVYRAFYQKLYTKHEGSLDGLQWLLTNSYLDSSQLSSGD